MLEKPYTNLDVGDKPLKSICVDTVHMQLPAATVESKIWHT